MSNVSEKSIFSRERVTRVLARTQPTMASPASFDADAVAAVCRSSTSPFRVRALPGPRRPRRRRRRRADARGPRRRGRSPQLEAPMAIRRGSRCRTCARTPCRRQYARQPSPGPESPLVSSPDGATRRDLTLDPDLTLPQQSCASRDGQGAGVPHQARRVRAKMRGGGPRAASRGARDARGARRAAPSRRPRGKHAR